MSVNLIHKYINDEISGANRQTYQNRSISTKSTTPKPVYDYDAESTNNLIKPLEGKGYLVNNNILTAPKEIIRDSAYSAKALYDGVRGKGNDHQIGKMNDLGLKIGGLAIATYLMTHRATPKTKAMEFVGFGAFLASMALWPKLAIEIPTRLIHGFNFRQQYVDEQGRKKYATQDPNYIPFDLYRGETKDTNLDLIGDKLGIPKNIQNRKEEVKNEVRKISVQDNTLWMMTAGIATPTMTALLSNLAEKAVAPVAEKMTNKAVNTSIDNAYSYLTNTMNTRDKASFELKNLCFDSKKSALSLKLESLKGKSLNPAELDEIITLFVHDFEPEMQNAAKSDIVNMIGGLKSVSNKKTMDNIALKINSLISSQDINLAKELSTENIKTALSEGLMRDSVHDMLSNIGTGFVRKSANQSETTFAELMKSVDLKNINFFEVTEATSGLKPAERLSFNIQKAMREILNGEELKEVISEMNRLNPETSSILEKEIISRSQTLANGFYQGSIATSGDTHYILNSISDIYKSKAPRDPKYRKLHTEIFNLVQSEQKTTQGYIFNDASIKTITEAEKHLNKYRVFNNILSKGAHFKLEMAPDTLAANSWNSVTNLLIKELGISDKEIKVASKSKKLTEELISGKLEAICANDTKYSEFIQKLAQKMAMFDEKIDTPNIGSTGRMMPKIEKGIEINCKEAGEVFNNLGLNEMRKKMVSSYSETMGVNTGSIMNSKLERLHVRANGIHNSYMRLLQTCEFFHRANKYSKAVANGTADMAQIAQQFGFTQNLKMNEEIISKGKNLLLSAHTNQFYNKMGTLNNPDFFKSLMWAIYRPSVTTPELLNPTTEATISILNDVKINGETPRRVFGNTANGRKSIGQSLKEFMEESYKSLGTIGRRIVKTDREALVVPVSKSEVSKNMQRASERFNLLGKTPSEMLHDAVKQAFNSKKWMKIFAPILGTTFALTVGAQFFFGNKHKKADA